MLYVLLTILAVIMLYLLSALISYSVMVIVSELLDTNHGEIGFISCLPVLNIAAAFILLMLAIGECIRLSKLVDAYTQWLRSLVRKQDVV